MPERQTDLGDGTWAPTFVPVDTAGNPLSTIGGGAITVANGSDIAEGATTDAAVAAGAAGSLSAKLRRVTQGLEDLKTLLVLAAGSAVVGKVGIDQTTPGTTDSVTVSTAQGAGASLGTTTDAAVVTNANGTLNAHLRGLVALLRKGSGSAPATVAVDDTATGTVILASNASRLSASFSNLHATTPVFIGTTVALTATNGIRIAAGATFTDDRSTSGWRAICSTGLSASVAVLEIS